MKLKFACCIDGCHFPYLTILTFGIQDKNIVSVKQLPPVIDAPPITYCDP